MISGRLNLYRVATASPSEGSCYRKSAHPHDLRAALRHRPTGTLSGRNMVFGEQPLQLFFRLPVYGPEAIARAPVADCQLRTEQLCAEQGISRVGFLLRTPPALGPIALSVRSPRCEPRRERASCIRSWKAAVPLGEPAIPGTHPGAKLAIRREAPPSATLRGHSAAASRCVRSQLRFAGSQAILQQTSLQRKRQTSKAINAKAWLCGAALKGHGFSRAAGPSNFVIPSGL